MLQTITEVPEVSFDEVQKVLHQQLVLILHAHGCQQKELRALYELEISTEETHKEKCKLPRCAETKEILDHIRSCFEPEDCDVPGCSSNREVIRHYKSCTKKSTCGICSPIFKAQVKNFKNRENSN